MLYFDEVIYRHELTMLVEDLIFLYPKLSLGSDVQSKYLLSTSRHSS